MKYNATVEKYFRQNKFAGPIQSDQIIKVESGVHANGAAVQFFLKIENKKIQQIQFCAVGSPILIALAEYVCEILSGESILKINEIDQAQLIKALDLEQTQASFVVLVLEALRKTRI